VWDEWIGEEEGGEAEGGEEGGCLFLEATFGFWIGG